MRQDYEAFCRQQYVPIQFQPWWLDAVCGVRGWKAVLATEKGGAVTGAMPYYITYRWGLPLISLPPFTTYAGPYLHYEGGAVRHKAEQAGMEKRIMTELIGQLPRVAYFKQNFRPEISNWLPFYWKKYRQTTRYTYVFQHTDNPSGIIKGFKNTLRTDIKKAARLTTIERDDTAWRTLLDLRAMSLERKMLRLPEHRGTFERLHAALQYRKQSVLWVARDNESGESSAALYLIHDQKEAAILLTGTRPALKKQCAVYRLMLEAIYFCAERDLSLDFEGSMDSKVERSFRSFGASLTQYSQVWRWF